MCNGAAISRETYAALFNVIGTTYGSGNGSTTFNLPNLVDKFVEGSETSGTVKAAGLPNITGRINDAIVAGQYQTSGAITQNWHSKTLAQLGSGSTFGYTSYNVDASASNSIYGKSSTVQPPAVTMKFAIYSGAISKKLWLRTA